MSLLWHRPLILWVLIVPCKGISATWSGRFSFGGYQSTERFNDTGSAGSDKNDFQILSSRFFLRGTGLCGARDWEMATDLRDKHDFFDKLDAERLSLRDRNEFQLRQLSTRYANPRRFWGFQLGRFPLLDFGATFVDGLAVETHFTPSFHGTYFGGYNPQKRERSYVKFDERALIYGAGLVYLSPEGGWSRNLYSSLGVVTELYDGHTDRNFIFQNLIYQWAMESRFISIVYYDMTPRPYVQNGNLIWQQGWSRQWVSDISYSAIDVIQYSRQREVLEVLPSSPYQEGRLKLIFRTPDRSHRLYALASYGERDVDGLRRQAGELGYIASGVWGPNWDIYLAAGARKNFTSHDLISRVGTGRFGRKWELSLDLEFQRQDHNNGTVLNAYIAETSASYFMSRQSFWTVSFQSATDEQVQILSAFVRYGYRFGSREIPPLRDGAPPRGPL